MIEESMLEDYFLLIRRIPGISLSPSEFWELDTFTTQKLLNMELDIIKAEEEQLEKANGTSKYVEQREENSEEMNSIVEMMSVDEDEL